MKHVTREAPSRFIRLMQRLERTEALDGVIGAVEPVAGQLVANPRVRRVVHGEATGIPLHVILTDAPFGAWFMAQFLDLYSDPGTQRAARRLVGLGVVSAVPTALTGWSEWALADRATRRVGVVHAAANAVAVLLFVGSWVARVRGNQRLGVRLARVGGGVLLVVGFTGGHIGTGRRAR